MSKHTSYWPEEPELQRRVIDIQHEGDQYRGHLVAPSKDSGARPLVLVIHNYQGLKFFDVDVAEYLARVGYVGLAIDMYGDRVPADERMFPEDVERVAGFQKKCFDAMVGLDSYHRLFRSILNSWLEAGLEDLSVDDQIAPAAIGYCFGGMAVLEGVRAGLNLSGVVSFHGLLQTGEDPNPAQFGADRPPVKSCDNVYNSNTIVLIENGADDQLVPDESEPVSYTHLTLPTNREV